MKTNLNKKEFFTYIFPFLFSKANTTIESIYSFLMTRSTSLPTLVDIKFLAFHKYNSLLVYSVSIFSVPNYQHLSLYDAVLGR